MWSSIAGLVSLCALLALPLPAQAQERPLASPRGGANFLSVSPLGFIGFATRNVGSYAFVYERLLTEQHGLLLEGNFIHVHGAATHLHLWTFGGTAGYRFHLFGSGNSPFLGVNAGYKTGFGRHGHQHGDSEDASWVQLNIRQLSVTGNLGYRWVWDSGFHLTVRLGAGHGHYDVTAPEPGIHAGAHAEEALLASRDALGSSPVTLDTELSLGFRF